MPQQCQSQIGAPVEESVSEVADQLADLEAANDRLAQDLIRQQDLVQHLTYAVRDLERRNLEILAARDQALIELQAREPIEVALRQKTEALLRSNRDLEQFASLAAHDLQEPLHSIQAFLDLLRVKHGSALDAQGQGYVIRVVKAAKRMQELIEGLLVYSRIDAPDVTGDSLPLQQIVEDILSDLGGQIEALQAEIHVGDLPLIRGDALHIRQLLQNLIGNALKFHQPGVAPVIHVSGMMLQNRRQTGPEKPGTLCQIEIQDQGIGIPEEDLGKIFGMFARLHRKDQYQGTGIGLAVCQRIAEQCGGRISVRSTLGGGTTFTVTLPA
ncbi:MAG: ATP-binding protein [Nitrospirota bacterium]|nr:ATP-binding protein [Nitrospirota bacterium]